ncbi:hypothetical protein [Aquisphaera insulae]|uniref:hypothetical protein n=1 Tax=Aquisphaera insulae TaxID=2712864 RepID=UPI0013EB99B8|nr:hypothetical protein [Aquisphaera insulae]
MASIRGKVRSFRPSIDGIALEERVVMNAAGTAASAQALLSRRELYQSYRAQFRAAANDLRQYLRTQIATAYANGTPDATTKANLQSQIGGAVNATAFRLSSQLGLLPEANDRLVARLQTSLLGNGRNSLTSRLDALTSSGRASRSASALMSAVDRAITQSTVTNAAQAGNFIARSPIYANSIDINSGARIPVQTYMAQQVVNQFANTLGSLNSGFGNIANAALVSGGIMSTDPAVQQTFANQLNAAVGIAANQLGNNLAVFPTVQNLFPSSPSAGGGTGTTTGSNPLSGVGNILFGTTPGGTPTAITTLSGALSAAPTTSDAFVPAVNSAFNSAFQNVASGLGSFFGTTTNVSSLPTSNFSSVFAPTFAGLGNGFNGGTSNGPIGFGTFSTSTGTSTGSGNLNNFYSDPFGGGFYGLTTNQNTALGFPTSSFSGFGLTSGTTTIIQTPGGGETGITTNTNGI